jgi:hypothetical protein
VWLPTKPEELNSNPVSSKKNSTPNTLYKLIMSNTEYMPKKQNLILGKDASLKMALRIEICVGLLVLSVLRETSQKLHGYFPNSSSLFPVTES